MHPGLTRVHPDEQQEKKTFLFIAVEICDRYTGALTSTRIKDAFTFKLLDSSS